MSVDPRVAIWLQAIGVVAVGWLVVVPAIIRLDRWLDQRQDRRRRNQARPAGWRRAFR